MVALKIPAGRVLDVETAKQWRDRAETGQFDLDSLMDGKDGHLAKLLTPIFNFLGEIKEKLA